MIQGIKKIIFTLFIGGLCLNSASAARSCSTSEKAELNKILPNIKVSYEEKEEKYKIDSNGYVNGEEVAGGPGYIDDELIAGELEEGWNELVKNYFNINITNITDQFYVEISNDYNDEIKTLNYSDSKDGILIYPWENLIEVTNFSIKIFSSDKTGCPGDLQKTLVLRTPRLNENYNSNICTDIPEFNLCQKFVTFDFMDHDDFVAKVDAYKEKNKVEDEKPVMEKEKNTWEKIKEFVINNKYYFIGGGIVVIMGAGVTVGIVIKKRRSIGL